MIKNQSAKQSHTSGKNTSTPTNRHGMSLTTFFTVILISVFLLISIIASLVYYRLTEFKTILGEITDQSIPAVTHSNKVNSQVNTLIYLIEGLTQASSQASRRIANQEIDIKLKEILAMTAKESTDNYLTSHITTISTELTSLNALIEQRLSYNNAIARQKEQMNQLYYKVVNYMLDDSNNASFSANGYLWTIELSNIVSISTETLTLARINQVKQSTEQVKASLQNQYARIEQLPENVKATATEISDQLKTILFGDNGLITLRTEQLRITGRAVGRGHFVRNLVNDLANLAEFESYQLNDAIQTETSKTSAEVKKQIRIMGLMFILTILFLLAVVLLIHKRVVQRLNILNNKVQGRISGGNEELMIRGNDEISDIARTFNYFAQKIEEQKQALQELSLTDSLTGIANRRALDERLTSNLQSARRQSWPLSVLIMDVDCFKAYNDNYGHAAGDECLKTIADILIDNKRREADFVARYGGEEFVYLLPESTQNSAKAIAQLLIDAIANANIRHDWSQISSNVTVSIGVATFDFHHPVSMDTLLKQADDALYQAKNTGRNRVVAYSDKSP